MDGDDSSKTTRLGRQVADAPLAAQSKLFKAKLAPDTEVALFSGGLDSAAGLYARRARRPGRLVAVSAYRTHVRAHAQRAALRRLRELGVTPEWAGLIHSLKGAGRSRGQTDASQRSRGFLFLAFGAAVASSIGAEAVSTFETGMGCINLALSPAQVGSQATRAMHPRTLSLAQGIFRHVLERPLKLIAPFFFWTKAELCQEAGRELPSIAAVTASCDEGEGHKGDTWQHCGLCTSCLFRRIALFSAGPGSDPTRYRDRQTARHGAYELSAFAQHGRDLSACTRYEHLLMLDPDVRFAVGNPVVDADAGEDAVLSLAQRYAREVAAFFERATPVLLPRERHPRKEAARDLFTAAR